MGAGRPEDAIDVAGSELDAVKLALERSRPGDLLLLISHEERALVLGLVQELRKQGWKPGQALPSAPTRT